MSEDCYFYTDLEKETIAALCVQCSKQEKTGWFWEGSKQGYGPWVYKCNSCNHIIHEPNREEYEKVETTHQNT